MNAVNPRLVTNTVNVANKMIKVGVLGSAFNPPHLGHKDILQQINHEFDEILLVPSFRHAFGKNMVKYEDRLAMASSMAQMFECQLKRERKTVTPILVSDVERAIGEGNTQPVYTYDVLQTLEERYQAFGINARLTFILGPDNASFDTWNKFYKAEEIKERWGLRSVSERLKVHSSQIRQLISGYPRPEYLFMSRLTHFLDKPVASYIYQHNLYGARA
ncbi:MAG: adenylyltransferase/cytidyltransferase family protein [Gammaproteobacteria bacterium]|nr:adenylyltransferase/cytidyltransferase family protein [Gammaproteobacteria bacterium]